MFARVGCEREPGVRADHVAQPVEFRLEQPTRAHAESPLPWPASVAAAAAPPLPTYRVVDLCHAGHGVHQPTKGARFAFSVRPS